jgi:CxxC-x17-CxxC domain-containing protein
VENILKFSSFKEEFNEKLAKILRYNEELYIDIKNNETWRKKLLDTIANSIKDNITKSGDIELPVISDNVAKNKESYRQALESCRDFIWFEDRFLNSDSLVLFQDIIKKPKVQSVRILTSLVHNPRIDNEFLDKIQEFRKILSQHNIKLEVKVVSTKRLHKKIHNRYVLGSNVLWDLPPSSAVIEGGISSIFNEFRPGTKTYEKISKDYVEWWNDQEALEIVSKWEEIKRLVKLYIRQYQFDKIYDANCTICGEAIKVSFIPDPGRPVYCDTHLSLKRKGKNNL